VGSERRCDVEQADDDADQPRVAGPPRTVRTLETSGFGRVWQCPGPRGTDALGDDVLGDDVLGTDVLGTDVLGDDVLGTDVLGDVLGDRPRCSSNSSRGVAHSAASAAVDGAPLSPGQCHTPTNPTLLAVRFSAAAAVARHGSTLESWTPDQVSTSH
jgi:hypothetical protein